MSQSSVLHMIVKLQVACHLPFYCNTRVYAALQEKADPCCKVSNRIGAKRAESAPRWCGDTMLKASDQLISAGSGALPGRIKLA